MRKRKPGRSSKVGLPPGTPVHIGEKKAERARLTVTDYDETATAERELAALDQCFALTGVPGVTWISVVGVHDVAVLQQIGDCFQVHPLVIEDISNTEQRPKLEDYQDYLFIVLKALDSPTDEGEVNAEQVSLIVGPNFVISFEERDSGLFDPVRERVRNGRGRLRKAGADYLAYALMDAIVDRYFVVLETIGEKVEDIEEELVTNPTTATLHTIHHLKREMILLRRSVWPLREVISGLSRGESHLIRDTTGVYLRDVHDHTIEVIDTIEALRDMVSGMLDIYLSSVSNRMNEIMKVLTIIATIFIPLTFLAGIYGMNFRYMPELAWHWGYPGLLAIMALAGGAMILYFRRRSWL
ncbi:MAG: magnesium/cobalt transporter CorA [Armatimonadota bacterium]|nr:MAG: magnesium/cobalt transporter CorA [Armatimonadota bacterium]